MLDKLIERIENEGLCVEQDKDADYYVVTDVSGNTCVFDVVWRESIRNEGFLPEAFVDIYDNEGDYSTVHISKKDAIMYDIVSALEYELD